MFSLNLFHRMIYKTDLKNREHAEKHKQDLKHIIGDEMRKQNNPMADRVQAHAAAGVVDDEGNNEWTDSRESYHTRKDPMAGLREDEENEELSNEILTARNYNRVGRAAKKKKQHQIQRNVAAVNGGMQPTAAPQVKLVICQVCSK